MARYVGRRTKNRVETKNNFEKKKLERPTMPQYIKKSTQILDPLDGLTTLLGNF